MEIPFSASEVIELNAFINEFNRIGETQIRLDNHLAEVIRHSVIRPWRARNLEKSIERRANIIGSLPPEADAELAALALKYSKPLVVSVPGVK